ncbi:glycosyl transferase, family 2 [Roseobacter sp. SK209-2-6]|uniref:glycosyltransferase n=1 Tax=Roseobacter sp. SK209-2-6 TaxID=388739 RepID=UPI0000F3CEFC|nr:glycosyltransferase family A protein [Roseobacter sp. SK209-2-6]EBA15962.1 glycosyl transferase, family 2 [Roseobacter sp. SK209-2-6]
MTDKAAPPIVDAVAIGRNEGARLEACLASLKPQVRRLVYVDSGSTDGSVVAARRLGAEVVELDMSLPFTAARARNAGLLALQQGCQQKAEFIQLVDGDCEVDADWIPKAQQFLASSPKAAVACGRRRERFPQASFFNQLCDQEWDTPIGEAKACGGDALMRLAALQEVGGYRDNLIAGEEPEMCLRLRQAGWTIWRLDHEMTLHDAQMTRFSQWWKRSRRAGHAFAEGAALHGKSQEKHWVAETRRATLWGIAIPAVILAGALLFGWWALLGFLVYPAQILRLSQRMGPASALLTTLGKFAESHGILEYWWNRARGKGRGILEYK